MIFNAMIFAAVFSAVSPDGTKAITYDGEARSLSVVCRGAERVRVPRPEMTVRGHAFAAEPVGSEDFRREGTELAPLYGKASVDLAANGHRIRFADGFALELIARDDAVAYRWTTDFDGEIEIAAECADLEFPETDDRVWIGYPDAFPDADGTCAGLSNWESVYTNMTLREAAAYTNRFAELPMVVGFADGSVLAVSESNQRDYPGWLMRGLRGEFAREPVEELLTDRYHIAKVTRHDYLARTKGRRTFPWRLFMLAENAAKLCENDAPYALADECELDDVSWIRPGMAQWEWWHCWNLTGVDFKAGKNTATYLHYIDFAAENSIPYLVMDGGWSKDYGVMNAIPEIDLVKVCGHARAKGVGIILWMPWASVIGIQEEAFRRYSEIGVAGLKLDGICRNDRYFMKYAEETARIAAKHRLVIDYHGISKPSGLSRTFPNILTYEGVHGLENTKWEGSEIMPRCDFPKNDVNQFFCRMCAGAMDYTPGAMRNMAKDEYRYSMAEPGSCGTRVHQLALYVLYHSPLQMLADSPSLYRANRECFDFMRKVPTVWDETRGLEGRLDEYAVCARRKGDGWYAAAISNWEARTLELDTAFLGEGEWRAEIFEDGANADREATDWKSSERRVRAGERLAMKLAPGGGWAAKFTKER